MASVCTITGQVVKGDGSAFANGTLTFNSLAVQTVGGAFVPITTATATTDANGNINGGSGISLLQGLFVQVSLSLNGNNFSQFTALVPLTSSATFGSFASGILQTPATITMSNWTPTLIATSSNPVVSYANQIGRSVTWISGGQTLVWLYWFVSWNSFSGGTGNARIGGNPNITCSNFSEGYIGNMTGSTLTNLGIQFESGTTLMDVIRVDTGANVAITNWNGAVFGQMLGFIVYPNF